MSKKVHLFKHNHSFKAVCGKVYKKPDGNIVAFNEFENDTPHERVCLNCKNTEEYRLLKAKHESKRPLEKEEFEEPKTQQQIDTEKYNLNEEQVEYLSRFDYEVVEYDYASCKDCLFYISDLECPHKNDDSGDLSCMRDGKEYMFELRHKTQKSLNEAIEKESDKEPLGEPYTWKSDKMIWVRPPEHNPKDVAFKNVNKQQADHYKNGVETIEKIETILAMLGEDITPREGYLIGNFIKYVDRLGLKDDKKKDAYKAADYINRLISCKWIHEK